MRIPVIAAALLALTAFSAAARPLPYGPGTAVGEVYGGSAWFDDAHGGVAVTGATYQECADKLAAAIAARSWPVHNISYCAKWPPYIRIRATDLESSRAEALDALKIARELRAQYRIDEYEKTVESSVSTVNVCEE